MKSYEFLGTGMYYAAACHMIIAFRKANKPVPTGLMKAIQEKPYDKRTRTV